VRRLSGSGFSGRCALTAKYYVHVMEPHVAAGFGKFVEYQTCNVAKGIEEAFPETTKALQ
jgi:hypothetical protein